MTPAPPAFAPKPANDFADFIRTYFERCRARVPLIEGNAGKWLFEDLIPGLSDFDTRFFVADSATAADWCRMSMEVGRVHLELAQERADWARNLEHLPGVNLKWSELLDPQEYFTEFSHWSFYHGEPARLEAARAFTTGHRWTAADDWYHWKKIALYYGRYDRAIDPAINLGRYENKYPLHSRLLHYLAPPVHSGVCLMDRRTTPGKLAALRRARSLFPQAEVMDRVLALLDCHYESPGDLAEPGLTELDSALESYLTSMAEVLLHDGPFRCPARPTPNELRAAVKAAAPAGGFSPLFENIKFARLMKGRLWFYAQEVPWFDSPPLIRNEFNRIGPNFYQTPLRLFARLVYGEELSAEAAVQRLEGEILSREDAGACRRFAALACVPCPDAELRTRARAISDIFDPFLCVLEHLLERAKVLGRFK